MAGRGAAGTRQLGRPGALRVQVQSSVSSTTASGWPGFSDGLVQHLPGAGGSVGVHQQAHVAEVAGVDGAHQVA